MTSYSDPSFTELVQMCMDFGLVEDYRAKRPGVRLRCLSEVYDVSIGEAELLLRGLLLGFFHQRTQDDLTLAQWAA